MTATLRPELRPRLRGVTHQWAAIVSGVLGVALVLSAALDHDLRAVTAAAVYALSVVCLFTSSAIYHRVTWKSVATRVRMRRVDHAAIFVLIAGSYTPITLLALDGTWGIVLLCVVWAGAALGVVLELRRRSGGSRWPIAVAYIALGWVAVAATPQLLDAVGAIPMALIALGGATYTAGAVIYARRRPDPVPRVFGYHELFHALVCVAAALHYAVIAFWVLPAA